MADEPVGKVVSYGYEKVGAYQKLPVEQWETLLLEPNTVYQYNFQAPSLVWWKPWTWFYTWFDPDKYVLDMRKGIAGEMGVGLEEVSIIWFYYNGDTRQFSLQLEYRPKVEVQVGVAIVTVMVIASVIGTLTWTAVIWRELFTGKPILQEILKFGKELSQAWAKGLKYSAYIAIAGAGVYALSKVVSLITKRKKEA